MLCTTCMEEYNYCESLNMLTVLYPIQILNTQGPKGILTQKTRLTFFKWLSSYIVKLF